LGEDVEALRRELDRVRHFPGFDSSQRIWWIYLRGAAEHWLERNEDPDIRTAYDRLKAFPENLPDEGVRWLALRQAVEKVLERQ
jgi:hypothetical protein